MTVSIHRQIAKLQYVRNNTNDIDEDIDIILSDDNGDDEKLYLFIFSNIMLEQAVHHPCS